MYDLIILGAGASGLMLGNLLQGSGLKILLVDNNRSAGKKLLLCGGGKGNLTNLYLDPSHYLSENPHFHKSALSQYTQYDAIDFFENLGVTWDQREEGRLYTEEGTSKILKGLLRGCSHCDIAYENSIQEVTYSQDSFQVVCDQHTYHTARVVVATGGVSFPSVGATDIGYTIAKSFGHTVVPPKPVLSPMVLSGKDHIMCKELSGVSLDVTMTLGDRSFSGPLLFTHFGISGLVVLQASLYWSEGVEVVINLLPEVSLEEIFSQQLQQGGKGTLSPILRQLLPKKLANMILKNLHVPQGKPIAELGKPLLEQVVQHVHHFHIVPVELRGFRTAEATAGGVSTKNISSKTMESTLQKGLYFMGEVLDVTGELGGYNLQWAWSSAAAVARTLISEV